MLGGLRGPGNRDLISFVLLSGVSQGKNLETSGKHRSFVGMASHCLIFDNQNQVRDS